MAWIRQISGELINLDTISHIKIYSEEGKSYLVAYRIGDDRGKHTDLIKASSREEAQAALNAIATFTGAKFVEELVLDHRRDRQE